MEAHLLALLEEFKAIKASNQKSIESQRVFESRLRSISEEIADVEKKLRGVNKQLAEYTAQIPKQVEVMNTYRVEPRSWWYVGLMVFVVSVAIWLSPSAKQSLREWEMERDYAAMQKHLDYHINNNPKTERSWQKQDVFNYIK